MLIISDKYSFFELTTKHSSEISSQGDWFFNVYLLNDSGNFLGELVIGRKGLGGQTGNWAKMLFPLLNTKYNTLPYF